MPDLLERLAVIPDPRSRRGRRYRLETLLAIVVCAMSGAGTNSLVAVAEWAQRADAWVLARLGAPFNPLTGRYRVPDEGTLREVFARLDAAVLTRAGFAQLGALVAVAEPAGPLAPDGVAEREQRRAHRAAADTRRAGRRRVVYAVDGKCLRGARRRDGSRVFVLSAARHGDAVTVASRQIGAKTNEVPEFAPLLDQLSDDEINDAVITADAAHAQREHAIYLVERRHAHYLVTVKGNQPTLSAQLRALPWTQVPVLHRSTDRRHGREEQRTIQVLTADDLLFPHARQVLRIRRRRRKIGARRWRSETMYAITDLSAEQVTAQQLAAWARGHWIIENSVHWVRDVTFGEDSSQIRTRNIPAVMAALRDLVRSTLRLKGWVNIAAGRRAHTDHYTALALHGLT